MSVLKSIQNAVPPIHPEGHKFILVFLAGTVLLGWIGSWTVTGHFLRQTRPTET